MKKSFNMFLISLMRQDLVARCSSLLGRVTDPRFRYTCLYNHQISAKAWDGRHSQHMGSFMDRFGAQTVCTPFTPQLTSLGPASHHVRLSLTVILILHPHAGGLYHRALVIMAEHQVSRRLLAVKALWAQIPRMSTELMVCLWNEAVYSQN